MRHEATSNGRTGLTWDTAFRALSSGRRRRLLALLAAEGEMTTSDVTRRLAEEEAGDENREEGETIEIALHHVHLPALQTAGLVEWNRADGTVSLASDIGRLPLFTPPSEPPVARRGAVTPAGCSDVE